MTEDRLPPYAIVQTGRPEPVPSAPLPEFKANRDPEYGGGRFSFFADKVAVAVQEYRLSRGLELAQGYGGRVNVTGDEWISPMVGSTEDAMARLRANQTVGRRVESYAMTSGAGSGTAFVQLLGTPEFISDAFKIAARAKGVLLDVLPTGELPDVGPNVLTGRFDTGATVSVPTTEGGSVSSTDPTSSLVSGAVATVSGSVDLSVQLLERSDPKMGDVALASELGAALAEQIDVQIINGSGSNGQTTGLLNASGIGSITAGTATQVTVLPAVLQALSTSSVNAGARADLVLVHPRREFWLRNAHDTTAVFSPDLPTYLGAEVVAVPAIPTTLSTTQDAILALVRDLSCSVFVSTPQLRVMVDVLSGTLQARVEAWVYLAVVHREVKATTKITGAGLTTPTFS